MRSLSMLHLKDRDGFDRNGFVEPCILLFYFHVKFTVGFVCVRISNGHQWTRYKKGDLQMQIDVDRWACERIPKKLVRTLNIRKSNVLIKIVIKKFNELFWRSKHELTDPLKIKIHMTL